jgi:hypothetical protein
MNNEQPKPEWIDWWREQIRVLTNRAIINMPLRGLCYRIDKEQKTVTLVVAARPAYKSETDNMTRACLECLGYKVDEDPNAIKDTPEEFADSLIALENTASNIAFSADFLNKLRRLFQ